MTKNQALRDLVMQRLESAAEEVFALIEKVFAEYEEEIVRLKRVKLRQGQSVQHKQQYVQTFVRPEVIPEHKVEEKTLCSSLEFAFTSLPLKSEDDIDKSAFLQQEPDELNGQFGAEEPGCSLDLQPINIARIQYSCSDADDSEDWENPAQSLDSQKGTSNGRSKKRRKRHQGLIDGGVTIKKEKEDSDTFVLNGPFSDAVETPFSCSVPNSSLSLAAQTHWSCKSVSCPECGVRLHRQHSLERHISAVHRREKPFRCTVCEKRFARKTDCAIHMRVHTGERPYSCPVCEKTFNVKNSLRRHLKLHKAHAGVHGNG
ncbi:uncharacterized protein [Eucyclogobius newberryi]|uniref:uncharacterized protein n=1 Tax=Eucyclogobius newberryi TaxID=166745 RepID=UPI003B5BBAEC